jgi:hydrogenase maturation protein HypF
VIDPSPLIRSIVSDLSAGMVQSLISAKFHNSMANMVVDVCDQIRETRGLEQVVLSGGVWQNMVFLHKVVPQLRERGYFVLVHREAPTNDGGIALGQLAVAQHRLGLSS